MEIDFSKTYEAKVEASFAGLHSNVMATIYRNGSAISKPLEHIIEVWFPVLKYIPGQKGYDYVHRVTGEKFELKTLTGGGCNFSPSFMIGAGRSLNIREATNHAKQINYIIADNRAFPTVRLSFKEGSALVREFPKCRISTRQADVLFSGRVEKIKKGRSFIPGKNTPDKDIVMTPFDLAKNIIDHFTPTGLILDPCRGRGAFYNQFPQDQSKDWCELSEGKDFFAYKRKVDWIITNPPWSKIKDMLVHSYEIADHICYLIPFNHFSTKHRLRVMKEHGFGIKEFYSVPTPRNDTWPNSGFQLGVTHIERGYSGSIIVSGICGQ